MKRAIVTILTAVLLIGCFAGALTTARAAESTSITNLFKVGEQGYTSHEGLILTSDFVSSQPVSVTAGQSVWFGPCNKAQYFQLVGFNGSTAVTDKVRGKEMTVVDTFSNGTVIYEYTVPSGVNNLVFSVPSSLQKVFTVSNAEITTLTWTAYWQNQGVDTDQYVGENTYYEVQPGTKLYVGAVTEANMVSSVVYDKSGSPYGNISKADLRLVDSFGGNYGIYCYTVPDDDNIGYVEIGYETSREQYYYFVQVDPDETVDDETIISDYIAYIGVPLPLESTVNALSGKTALFLGDSITYGARDRANIYGVKCLNAGAGGWAARIGYYAGMDVTNNGVSGACITTARELSNSAAHYIYNNLVATKGTTYDYVIMHGMFNDASEGVDVGTPQGMVKFQASKADVTTFAGGLELLFYTAREQNPDAILGFIVNFQTERTVDQTPYAEMAIRICEDWGIPYLDLYHNSGFSVEFDDGLHPSSAGYDSMYTIVANWMAGLGDQSVASDAKVMSYNVYYGEDTAAGITSIENRQEKAIGLINSENPDILMLQEATAVFMSKAKTGLSGYDYYGYCHKCTFGLDNLSGGSSSCSHEMAPILWNSEKYSLEGSGTIRTADHNVASENYPRCINWVVLRDQSTADRLLVMNYHADPNDEAVRNAAAQVVLEQMKEISKEYGNIPAIIGGDWNMAVGSVAYNTVLAEGMRDIRTTINPKATGSFNDWTRTDPSKFSMGDYLFMTETVNTSEFRVMTNDVDSATGIHISDHCPIVAEIAY